MALNLVEKIDGNIAIRNVLVSVSDKTGLENLIPGLLAVTPNIHLFSTGGTYSAIKNILGSERASKHLVAVSDYTGQPEMQGGLVKTLDFKIYLGLLSEQYNTSHQADLERTGTVAIDMVVVNLYPFQAVVAQSKVTPEQARTNIDIGGPCMIRASAKNYLRVAPVVDPLDYNSILTELEQTDGCLSLDTRLRLMKKAFSHTATYDTAIAEHFAAVKVPDLENIYCIQNT